MKTAPGQLDLFADAEEAERAAKYAAVPRCMFYSLARGPAARTAEFEAWKDEFGNFGSYGRSHAWRIGYTVPNQPTSRCQATVLTCDVRHDDHPTPDMPNPACSCATRFNELMYRGACTGCNWEGEPRTDENPAAEDALDHAWPGWRDVPIVAKWPGRDQKQDAAWWAKVHPLYPEGWLEDGGPIRTYREPGATRHNAYFATPYFGYDVGVLKPVPEKQET